MKAPHDLEAEKAIVGDLLNLPEHTEHLAVLLSARDFYSPDCAVAFTVLIEAWKNGQRIDGPSLGDAMREAGRDPGVAWLADILSAGAGAWKRNAETLIRLRARRDILHILTKGTEAVPDMDPFDLADSLAARLSSLQAPTSEPPSDFWMLDEFADLPENVSFPWVVPGLLRRGWRCVVVGTEGGGKSTLFRAFAIAAAQGLNPLTFTRIEPVRTLLVDLENSADAISDGTKWLRQTIKSHGSYEPGKAWLWHRPSGVDLRARRPRMELESILSKCKPDLVTLGPLYKAHRKKDRESDEQIAAELMEIFDDLRTRHGFALLLEHHAGQMDTYGHRKLRPYGSALWLRWPELGLAMEPDDGGVRLERWRGDRMSNSWPQRLARGTDWPWVAA